MWDVKLQNSPVPQTAVSSKHCLHYPFKPLINLTILIFYNERLSNYKLRFDHNRKYEFSDYLNIQK